MPKFDLYVTSVPDNKAKLIIARHIASVSPSIPLQTAMGMAEKPPLLLFRGLELREAEQHIIRLKKSGIGFRINESKSEFSESENAQNQNAETQSSVSDAQRPADVPKIGVDSQMSAGSPQSIEISQKANASEPQRVASHPQNVVDMNKSDAASQKSINTPESAAANSKKNADPIEEYVGSIRRPEQPSSSEDNSKKTKSDSDKKHKKSKSADNQKISKDSVSKSEKNDSRRFLSGIRVGSLNAAEQPKKRAYKLQAYITLCAFAIVAAVLFFLPKETTFAIKSADAPTEMNVKQNKSGKAEKSNRSASSNRAASSGTDSDSQDRKSRTPVSDRQRQQANAFLDSARAQGNNNLETVVAFYKAAISFNPQNLAAWQGLVQAYRDLGKESEAREAEEQMRKIFGGSVDDIASLVKPYGELLDTYKSGGGTYRVEYRSNKRSKKEIMNDVYLLTRAVRGICSCQDISIFASTGAGRGLLSHSDSNTSVHSSAAFSKQAKIIWLE